MACRDCVWWDIKSAEWRLERAQSKRRKERGLDVVWSRCLFDERGEILPVWVIREEEQGELNGGMLGHEGEGCPQFKERTDGKADPR